MANQYVKKSKSGYNVVDKQGKVLSKHATKAKAEASFRAMMRSKHK